MGPHALNGDQSVLFELPLRAPDSSVVSTKAVAFSQIILWIGPLALVALKSANILFGQSGNKGTWNLS
jgi:hypothetical protein